MIKFKKTILFILLVTSVLLLNISFNTVYAIEVDESQTEVPEIGDYTGVWVDFISNDGSSVDAQYFVSGNKAVKPADPTKDGYTFAGWYTNEGLTNAFDFNTIINSDITLYAKWEAIPVTTYKVTFESNGGTGTMSDVEGLTGTYTLPSNEFTAPSGKEFKGWSITENGAVVTSVEMNANITVYAIWEDFAEVNENNSSALNNNDNGPKTSDNIVYYTIALISGVFCLVGGSIYFNRKK